MPTIQFGFTLPADQLDKARRATFVDNLNRALRLVRGHFGSVWLIDHLQFGDADVLEGFTTLSYMAAQHPSSGSATRCCASRFATRRCWPNAFVDLGVDTFMLDCGGFPDLTALERLVAEVLPALRADMPELT